MRIGFDVSQTGTGKAGCGFYAHAMAKAMIELAPANRYTLLPSFGDFYFDARMPVVNPYPGVDVHYGPRHLSRETARRFWNGDAATTLLDGLDVVHANNYWCPTRPTTSRVVYTLYDLGYVVDPAWTTEVNRRGCFDGVFRAAIAADWIVAISEASRRHYLAVFPSFPAERIRVIYPCSRFVDARMVGRRPDALAGVTDAGFWLSVGTIEPRKNQRRLAEAYAAYRRSTTTPKPLVFAGGNGWMMEDFRSHLEGLGIAEHVILTGYVADDELVWLYEHCHANLYPSLFEGFGLPVLEGMQFGAATVASDRSSIPEVTGDAALLLDPDDVEGWTRALLRIDRDAGERERLKAAAQARAAAFEWKDGAHAMLQLYADAMASPKLKRTA